MRNICVKKNAETGYVACWYWSALDLQADGHGFEHR